MKEDLRDLICEWFANCTTPEEVAELYADIKMENQIQMKVMMESFRSREY